MAALISTIMKKNDDIKVNKVSEPDNREETIEERKANAWTEGQALNKEEIKQSEEEKVEKKVVKLNYVLDQLKNMKVAKVNAKKPMTTHWIEKDDVNTRYEFNSAVYLVVKEEIDKMERGYTWSDNDTNVKMSIEKKHNEEDKAENNPKTVTRWNVTDENNKFESNITMNLYHTNQGIHFQGGRRNGRQTTSSLAADLFETWSMLLIQEKGDRIKMIKEAILEMDLRRKPFLTAHRLLVKTEPLSKDIFKCTMCPYKSVKMPELRRHMFILHRNKATKTEAKKRAASPPKIENPSKKEAVEKPVEMVDISEPLAPNNDTRPERVARVLETVVEETSSEVEADTNEECINCIHFSSNEKGGLEKHMIEEHDKVKESNILLTRENIVLKLQVDALSKDLNHEREVLKNVKKEKEMVESDYVEAARPIAEQQEQVTIREEQIKVLGELISLEDDDDDNSKKEVAAAKEGDGWAEMYEDVTNEGNLVPHMERTSLVLGCKKCDKVLKSDHELREHMMKHYQLEKHIFKCDKNEHINHAVDNHSPKHTCETCKAEFSTKHKLLQHIFQAHAFTYTANTQPDHKLKCYDCSESFSTKPELMNHKTQTHFKTRLCSFYHGTGRGCKFPANVCFNIHQENITPTNTDIIDFRKRIFCKNGENCVFNQRSSCFYKHLENHVRTKHPSQVLRCMNCHSEFKSKGDFDHHMRTVHSNSDGDTDTYAAIVKLGQQMSRISQRLQFF